MSCKLKSIVVFLRILSNFIVLRNFGKNIYIYIYIYIYITMQKAYIHICQESFRGGLTLPTVGLKYSFQGTTNAKNL